MRWIDGHCKSTLAPLYSIKGGAAKPIRLMNDLLVLKQLYNLSDEVIVDQWQMNPYFQVFCGAVGFQTKASCHATELVRLHQRIGKEGQSVYLDCPFTAKRQKNHRVSGCDEFRKR